MPSSPRRLPSTTVAVAALSLMGLSGDIDEAAVYARALPAARVARHDEVGRGL